MKKSLVLLLAVISIFCVQGQKTIQSNIKNIKVIVNGKPMNWRLSPETNPDRLKIYCSRKTNEVIFQTDNDTAIFVVANNDSIRFLIILNSKDTAHTEIIGLKELPDKITNEEKVYWLSQIWSEAKYNFVNIDRLKFDLDSLYKSFISPVLATRNDFEYYHMLQKFMANLHDGHSQVSDDGQFYQYTDYIPVSLQDFNKKIYITAVRKMPELDSAWVGAELMEIEDIPTSQYLETLIFPFISSSTEQHLWMQGVYKIQSDFKDHPFRGTIKKSDGTIEKIVIQRNGEETRTGKDKYWGPVRNYSQDIVDVTWLKDSIAFIGFNRFSPENEAISEFDKIARELYKAKGVIIDLRNNGGGSTEVAWQLQKYLTRENYFLNYAWETRVNDGVRKANGNWKEEYKDYFINKAYRFEKPDTIWVSDTMKRIVCPVVILIGRFTFSAAEDFLVNIYEHPGRPVLIGEETGGSTGSPLVLNGMPGGGYARICARRICYPLSYKRFVNSGIKPDIEVTVTIKDYLERKDAVLDQAITTITRLIH